MRVINRTDRSFRLDWYKTSDSDYIFTASGIDVLPNADFQTKPPFDNVQIGLRLFRLDVAGFYSRQSIFFSPFGYWSEIIIAVVAPQKTVNDQYRYGILNWSNLNDAYVKDAYSKRDASQKVENPAKIASSSVKAIGTALKLISSSSSAMAPLAPIAGLADLIVSIIDAATTGTTDRSIDIEEFKAAVRQVIREELDFQSAEQAATIFMAAANDIDDFEHVVKASPHLLSDFMERIEGYEGGAFSNWMTHMHRHPEESKHIVAAYALGIVTYIKIIWYHFVKTVEADGALIVDDNGSALFRLMKAKVERCLGGLVKAIEAVDRQVQAKIDELHAWYMGNETELLRNGLTANICGLETLTYPQSVVGDIKNILSIMDDDMSTIGMGMKPKHFWKSTWKNIEVRYVPLGS